MARIARVEVFAPDEIAIVHVLNRTVRRCYLLGNDPLTGRNYDHRKMWLEDQLRRLAAWFGIDLLCHAVMSNHFHLVLRSRPDVVATWDDSEVARRWRMLCPLRKDDRGKPAEPTEADLNMIRTCPKLVAEIRSRLSDISWWMRLLSQNIAQRANRDDKETGKFWQARYRAVRLLDETAILACAAYVDLNPIRAAMAKTLEESQYTSVQHRIEALREKGAACKKRQAGMHVPRDGYLAPLSIDERRDPIGPCAHRHGQRASDRGFLPMPVTAYVELLDWTARQIVRGKRVSTPASARPVLERLGLSAPTWCALVKDFGRLFYAVAGQPHSIDAHRSRRGSKGHRYKTRRKTRELLSTA
jgi:hypothetical protein